MINTKVRGRIRTKAQHSKHGLTGTGDAAAPQLWRQDNPAFLARRTDSKSGRFLLLNFRDLQSIETNVCRLGEPGSAEQKRTERPPSDEDLSPGTPVERSAPKGLLEL